MLLGIYPNMLKTYVHTKTSIQTCIAALFIIAKTWRQAKCLLVSVWINKLLSIQTKEYYSVLKRNELSNLDKTWRKLKCILLREDNLKRLHTV